MCILTPVTLLKIEGERYQKMRNKADLNKAFFFFPCFSLPLFPAFYLSLSVSLYLLEKNKSND